MKNQMTMTEIRRHFKLRTRREALQLEATKKLKKS